MKIVSCLFQGERHIGVVDGDTVMLPALSESWPFGAEQMLGLIARAEETLPYLRSRLATGPKRCRVELDSVELLAPIPRPAKNIMCLGWNYVEHVRESSEALHRESEPPAAPVVFTKAVTTVNSPFGTIPFDPELSQELDWEVELGVVIGRGGKAIPVERALGHVFGYLIINDISARDLQRRHRQFFLGKSLDGSCPMGPGIVTADEVPDPQNLGLRCRVNGILKQDSNTRFQIFDVATVISILSRGMTLEAGDIISTGTPSGVGFARTPPEFLRPGDQVACEIDGLGRIANHVAYPVAPRSPRATEGIP